MKNAVRIAIIMIALGCLVVGYYYYLSHRNTTAEETKPEKEEELTLVLNKDFVSEYPETPRSVIKWYNRIICLYYDSETKSDDVDDLCDQAMMLMDAALLQENPRDTYIMNVRADIEDYANHERRVVATDVCSSADVEFREANGSRYAYVQAYYFIKEGSNYTRTYQKFALRKDESGNHC